MFVQFKKALLDHPIANLSTAAAQTVTVRGEANIALLVSAIALLAGLSVAPTLPALLNQWLAVADYNYSLLIAPLSLLWLWRSAGKIPLAALHPEPKLLIALIAASGMEYVLWQGHSELGALMLLPPIVWLAIAAVTGWQVARALIAPVAYFYFAIPLWDQLLPMLQQMTIFGASSAMRLAMVPVTVTGSKISIAEGTFEVLYECSGMRYLIVALALAYLMACLDRMPWRRMALFLALTVGLALVANWVRIFIVMYAGHVTGMRHYFITDNHKGLGHWVFAGLLVLIYWLAGRMHASHGPLGKAAPSRSPAVLGAPTSGWRRNAIAVAVILTVFVALTTRAGWMQQAAQRPQLNPVPVAAGQWQGPLPSQSSWQPEFTAAADARRFAYVSGAERIEVYLNIYGVQSQGRELVFFDNTLYAPGKWQLVKANSWNAVQASFGLRPLLTEQLDPSGTRWLFAQLYVVNGWRTASGLFAQALYGLSTLQQPAPAGMLGLMIPCMQDCAAARDVLDSFWMQMGDALVASIPTSLTSLRR